jgi:hypothetical protein
MLSQLQAFVTENKEFKAELIKLTFFLHIFLVISNTLLIQLYFFSEEQIT